jgi:hypothetical protein
MEPRPERLQSRWVPRPGALACAACGLLLLAAYLTLWLPFQGRVEALRAIEAARGTYSIDARGPRWLRRLTGYHHIGSFISNPRVGFLDRVGSVTLGRRADVGAALPHVAPLGGLAALDLSYSTVTDDDLVHLRPLDALEKLTLAHVRVNGRGFRVLNDLPHLKVVNLAYSPIRDHALNTLEHHPSLERVGVIACRHLTPGTVERIERERPGWLYGADSLPRCWADEQRSQARRADTE